MRRLRGEEGTALLTAIVVSMVVVLLGSLAMSVAIHNAEQAGRDRRRVQAIGAAEAGVDYYLSYLQETPPEDVECGATGELTATPVTQYSVSATFYDEDGLEIACPFAPGVEPDSALIRSVGTSSAANPARTMEALVQLSPRLSNPLGEAALFSDAAPGLNSAVQINGYISDDADVYTNGSATTALAAGTKIGGHLFAQGDVIINKNAEVRRGVHANGSVTMNNQSRVLEYVTSSTSSITIYGGSIGGDARAGTTITVDGNGKVHGLQMPNSPSPPPPLKPFPEFTYDPTAWQLVGYTIHNFTDCDSARSFIEGITSGDRVVRITAPCILSFPPSSTTTVNGNLAIIHDGGFNMDAKARFTSGGGEKHDVYFIVGLGDVDPCDFTMASNTSFGTGLNTFIYTPCTVDLSSTTLFVEGQIFGGEVIFNAAATLNYLPMPIPGVGGVGFKEDIVYLREVVTSA